MPGDGDDSSKEVLDRLLRDRREGWGGWASVGGQYKGEGILWNY